MKENGVIMQYFEWYLDNEPHLWNLLKDDVTHLKDIGVTAIWMPPAFKCIGGIQDVGYGVYDIYDLGEFNQQGTIRTKYGTKEEYLSAIEVLHQHDLLVYSDIVLNHKMGADENEYVKAFEVNQKHTNEKISLEEIIQVPTRFTFPQRHQKYSDFIWDWTCFDGIDYDILSKRHATFLFKDKQWDEEVDDENDNFDYLMGADIDFSNKNVINELDKWGMWYLNLTQVDGLRLDAVKHISASFYRNWIQKLRNNTQKELFAVGEYWHGDVNHLLHYLDEVDGSLALFDVPLHYHFYEASYAGEKYNMAKIFEGTLVQCASQNAVTFVDNHDTQPSQGLQSWVADWFKPLAYALILLRKEGYPCIFYGDYYGIKHDQIDPKRDILDQLLWLRKNFALGEQKDYFDDYHVIGWTRENGLACLMSNQNTGFKRMYVGLRFAGQMYYDALHHIQKKVTIDENGYGEFEVQSQSVSIYIPIGDNGG